MKLFVKQSIIEKLRTRNQFIREYKKQSQYWREHPAEFLEKMYGIRLHWYQMLFLKMFNKNKLNATDSVIRMLQKHYINEIGK